jgi:SAM-dependent MidA family methyltransferase
VSALKAELIRLIAEEGPLPVSRFMALCLGHPRYGYYMTRDPFGAAGDFTTAPEISQMFGEMIGLWAAHLWQAMGQPSRFALIEIGPGRGTLMADMLRATRILPGFRDAAAVHLVETSPVLREIQAATLAGKAEPVWHERVETALEGPAIIVANELLDALPLDQFVMTEQGWRERLVGLDGEGRMAFGLAREGPLPPPACGGEGACRCRSAGYGNSRRLRSLSSRRSPATSPARAAGRSSSTTARCSRASATRCRRCAGTLSSIRWRSPARRI